MASRLFSVIYYQRKERHVTGSAFVHLRDIHSIRRTGAVLRTWGRMRGWSGGLWGTCHAWFFGGAVFLTNDFVPSIG